MKQVLKHFLSPIDGMLLRHKVTETGNMYFQYNIDVCTVQAYIADELNYCKSEPKLVIRIELKPEYPYF